ncbi:alpha/beta fold hydrolase [Spelaeicoccus albus]|uniref:Pimeloyl-ACP methyl ester carboxylesterase n=1 Tax=Spelaeicoccus albus TaxID=1280376 RepID=A0A7Z0A972_9MICO|nr:alpha/beta hydrolase [Spelaeicoccus albus]NYI66647.1 pimeloyl-ACP methyl ester carboxylesterase [Spelaeicoccus albus]
MGQIEVAGLPVWHEVSGDGDPLVLLHGAFAGASSFFAQTPSFVEAGFRVHVPERRGHGHTPDVDGPLNYSVMADDTIAYLDQEVDAPAHLVGWSDGAVVAVLVARRRPDLVARMVLIGQYLNSAGKVPGGELIASLESPDMIALLRRSYGAVSPDGADHFPIVHAKTMAMIAAEPEIALDSLRSITAPALVIQGDRDEVTVEHSVAVVASLPDARLAVLPGTHALPVERPDLVNALIVSFLRNDDTTPDWSAFTG